MKELQAKEQASLDALKIPEVALSQEQIAAIKKPSDESSLAWVSAGTQKDGTTFVCYVSSTPHKSIFGQTQKPIIQVHAGSFDSSGAFRSHAVPFMADAQYTECILNGMKPPVTRTTSVTVVRSR
jgi:hypothetical protein